MEINKTEVATIEQAISEVIEAQMRELNEFQLALVGGGIGEVIVG